MRAVEEVLRLRGAPLQQAELWAICLEGAKVLSQAGPGSTVSPATLLLDPVDGGITIGALPSLDAVAPYLPPELAELDEVDLQSTRPSVAANIFALAGTLFVAASHELPEDREAEITEDMEVLLSQMADDVPAERADIKTVIDLASAGLTLCIGEDSPESGAAIVAALVRSPEAVGAGATTAPGVYSDNSNEEVDIGRGENCFGALLQELRLGVQLRTVSEDDLNRPPALQLSARDQLLADIRAGCTLAAVPIGESDNKDEGGGCKSNSARATNIAKALRSNSSTDRGGAQVHRKRKLLKPVIDADEIFGDWDPEKAVKLSFMAQSTPITTVQPKPKVEPDPKPVLESPGAGRSQGGMFDKLKSTVKNEQAGISQPPRRRLSAAALVDRDGIASDENSALPATQPADTAGSAEAMSESAKRVVTDKASAALDRARSLFRRRSSNNGWSEARAAIRDKARSSPEGSAMVLQKAITIGDWRHIRVQLVKAELENLRDENPSQVDLIASLKACVSCGTKFGRFKTLKKCLICDHACCATCTIKFTPPKGMTRLPEVDASIGKPLCMECDREIRS